MACLNIDDHCMELCLTCWGGEKGAFPTSPNRNKEWVCISCGGNGYHFYIKGEEVSKDAFRESYMTNLASLSGKAS